MTHEEIAEKVGRSRSAVTNLMRLLMLHEEVKTFLQLSKIEMGHARALLALEKDDQVEVAKKIIRDNLSVRDAEKVVRKKKQMGADSYSIVERYFEEKILDWTEYFSTEFSSKVNINLNSNGVGKLVIHIQSLDEIEMIIHKIKKKC